MRLSGRQKFWGGLAIVFSLGSGLFVVHVVHLLGEREGLQTFLYGIAIPMGCSVVVLLGGMYLWHQRVDADTAARTAGWCLLGGAVLGVGALLTIRYQAAEGVAMSDRAFVVFNTVSAGAVVGLVVAAYDSRQQAARAEAERLSRQLTVLNRLLRHDIRNDANIIQGNAELLETGDVDATDVAATIRKQAAELADLGERARDVEQMFRKGTAEPEPVDVVPVVERAVDRIAARHPEAEFVTDLPESEPALAHPLVETAVWNLIENAVVHNDAAPPRIEVTVSRTEEPVDHVAIRIEDNGPGIPQEEVAVIERGYETALEHTSGLGLWLANWIVEESDGQLRFDSSEMGGAAVHVLLSTADAEADTPATGGATAADEGAPNQNDSLLDAVP